MYREGERLICVEVAQVEVDMDNSEYARWVDVLGLDRDQFQRFFPNAEAEYEARIQAEVSEIITGK